MHGRQIERRHSRLGAKLFCRTSPSTRPDEHGVRWFPSRHYYHSGQPTAHSTCFRAWVCSFKSLSEALDTPTPSCELLFHVLGALAQFERALISERLTAGLEGARNRSRVGGRPRALSSEKLEAILEALDSGVSKAATCRTFGVKRSTLIETLTRLER